MDGNGRWARARGLPRVAGHRAGADAVRRVVEAAPRLGIERLTLFAFSSDNWRRPENEIEFLMELFAAYLLAEAGNCAQNGIKLQVIGRRDRLPGTLVQAIEDSETATAAGTALHLCLAVDYSARDMILRAARRLSEMEAASRDAFSRLLTGPDVDLLIRTGGEQRLSDFLLWESAYAELVFSTTMWPDFDLVDLETAVQDFYKRERRFGGLPEPAMLTTGIV